MRKHHNKLYYGKYRYKTVFKMPGSSDVLSNDRSVPDQSQGKECGIEGHEYFSRLHNATQGQHEIPYAGQERDILHKRRHVKDLIGSFTDYHVKTEIVDPKFGLLDKDTVGCDRLPHGKYQYQVHLRRTYTNTSMKQKEKHCGNSLRET
jgi:hypothetical protein